MKEAPDTPVDIRIECQVHHSEDPSKVVRAVKNVINNCSPEPLNGRIQVLSKNLAFLDIIYEQIRSRRVMGVFRKALLNNMTGNSTWFYLNKQAAYVGIVSICEEESESPLGPIKVTLRSSDLESVINWLIEL